MYHSPDDHALTLIVDEHVPVHVVRQSVDVRWILVRRLEGDITIII